MDKLRMPITFVKQLPYVMSFDGMNVYISKLDHHFGDTAVISIQNRVPETQYSNKEGCKQKSRLMSVADKILRYDC